MIFFFFNSKARKRKGNMNQTKLYKKTTDLGPRNFKESKEKKEGRKLSKTVNISPDPDFQMGRAYLPCARYGE